MPVNQHKRTLFIRTWYADAAEYRPIQAFYYRVVLKVSHYQLIKKLY